MLRIFVFLFGVVGLWNVNTWASEAPSLQTEFVFEAPVDSKYEWLNRAVFIGVGERLAGAAVIRFHLVK